MGKTETGGGEMYDPRGNPIVVGLFIGRALFRAVVPQLTSTRHWSCAMEISCFGHLPHQEALMMKEFGDVRFIARHGRISDAHGERRSIDFCGIVVQRLPFGKTVDVKLGTFTREAETVDVIESGLQKVGTISPWT